MADKSAPKSPNALGKAMLSYQPDKSAIDQALGRPNQDAGATVPGETRTLFKQVLHDLFREMARGG